MKFSTEQIDDILVITLQTEILEDSNSKEFRARMTPLLEQSQKVVFDMNQVKFIDSSGCKTVLSCLRQLNANGGDLKLSGVQKPVRTLFVLARMHRIIEIYDNKDDAVSSFQSQ